MPTIFLSPSTQEWNPYINGGNEELYMNLVADEMEPYLRSSGIKFDRNDPDRAVTGAISDSNSKQYDVHYSLHSNAGGGEFSGKLTGVDIYYSPFSASSERLATIVANSMKNVYPDPSDVIILPTTSLGEVTQTRAVAILAELGYHDNVQDEAWIKANIKPIAVAQVQALADYFGIPFIEATPARNGVVTTDGSNLNIRQFPSTEARIIGSIPFKAAVTVLGQTGNWYVIDYNDIVGYSTADFITI